MFDLPRIRKKKIRIVIVILDIGFEFESNKEFMKNLDSSIGTFQSWKSKWIQFRKKEWKLIQKYFQSIVQLINILLILLCVTTCNYYQDQLLCD